MRFDDTKVWLEDVEGVSVVGTVLELSPFKLDVAITTPTQDSTPSASSAPSTWGRRTSPGDSGTRDCEVLV